MVKPQPGGAAGFARDYVYDLQDRLLVEHDATTGATLREYVWFNDLPLAALEGARRRGRTSTST